MTFFKIIIAAMVLALMPVSSYANNQIEQSKALLMSAEYGHLASVMAAIQNGANVNYGNDVRETAMHKAAAKGHLRIIQYLRSQNGNINARTVKNWIPLHHAVRFGQFHVVNYLLASKSPLYFRTTDNVTVFDIAEAVGDVRMMRLLDSYRR